MRILNLRWFKESAVNNTFNVHISTEVSNLCRALFEFLSWNHNQICFCYAQVPVIIAYYVNIYKVIWKYSENHLFKELTYHGMRRNMDCIFFFLEFPLRRKYSSTDKGKYPHYGFLHSNGQIRKISSSAFQ